MRRCSMRGTIDHVWENETKGGQKYLTVQMNGERYSVWDSKYFDSIREGATVDYDLKQSGNFTHLIDVEPVTGNGNGNGVPPYQPNSKDTQIARMSCLKSASEILAPMQLDPDKKKQLTIDTARFFERYGFEDGMDEQPGQLHPQPGGTGGGGYRLAELGSNATVSLLARHRRQ
jgi:hypothetical protein